MSQGPSAPAFGILSGPIGATLVGTLPPGAPVYTTTVVDADGNATLLGARANAEATCDPVVGLLIHAAVAEQTAAYQFSGPLALTTAQWDAVTGDSGGLNPGDRYFVSSATAGRITNTPPSAGGTFVFQVGVALSANVLSLQFGGPAVDLL